MRRVSFRRVGIAGGAKPPLPGFGIAVLGFSVDMVGLDSRKDWTHLRRVDGEGRGG
jgi:hypothetical protein